MADDTPANQPESERATQPKSPPVSRRWLLGASASAVAGLAVGSGVTAAVMNDGKQAIPWPSGVSAAGTGDVPTVAGLHLQFGADAAREVVVSWHTTRSVTKPMVRFGSPDGELGSVVEAQTSTYRDAKSGIEVQVHHARLTGLEPDSRYIYAAGHDGVPVELGTLRTAPSGRARFRFTSFGDQGTPTLGKVDPASGKFVNDNLGSPVAADVTTAVESVAPLFNLVNGDLCYANIATDRIRTWNDWWTNNSRSARHRPWMPAPGNHENESGNGDIGYAAYQTYFTVPNSGSDEPLRGLWYAFTVGGMRVIAVANDDVCLQDGGDSYVRGYSGGAQRRWLAKELANARADKGIDWVVVFMHQTAISSAKGNGADLGIRGDWLPLFDQYQVDLVLCGHEHHYERSHPVRGTLPTDTLTPNPVEMLSDAIDTTKGTVHLVIGGGGTSVPSNSLFFPNGECRVIMSVGAPDPANRNRMAPNYVMEQAVWSAFKDSANPYGFCSFDVDPGTPGGRTTIEATYFAVTPAGLTAVDTFTLTRPRSDALSA
ncbi:metallophosphoesterase family protein [Aldersonia sp. NBC_00410]|uniref:purple acid phosphatase family protein n=1 Tax=Aldersonia sp. NBC_00410 TaxID=2975954 RepID=UPI00225B3276|nr:metallophosphoesterase family protein [Aldersonia sp. NBC_00410]MCX5045492.1 metallophosphoesterase family protein [Aldersonia sp. NBC_00410]